MSDHKDRPAVIGDLRYHPCHLGLSERLKRLLGLLESADGRPAGGLRQPQQYRDEQEPLRTTTLAEDRNLHIGAWESEAQSLKELPRRYSSNLELGKLICPKQSHRAKVISETCEHARHSLVDVDAVSSLTQRVLQRGDGGVKIDTGEHSLEQAALIEAQMSRRVARATIEYPADLCPMSGSQARPGGLLLRELVQHIEVLGPPDPNAHDRLDSVSVWLGNEHGGFLAPALQVLEDFGDEIARQRPDRRLDRKSLGGISLEVVDLVRARSWTPHPGVQIGRASCRERV